MAECKLDFNLWGIRDKEQLQDSIVKSFGVGFYSDEENLTTEEINSKCNSIWRRMLALCYSVSDGYYRRGREYTICKEWYDYNNFKKWFDENYYTLKDENVFFSAMCIRKNNTHFCPQLCTFVPQFILGLLYGFGFNKGVDSDNKNICGVQKVKRNKDYSYKSMIKIAPELNNGSDTYYIGTFDTEEEAFVNYKIAKELYIKGVAYHYKDKIPEKLYNALLHWEVERDDNTAKYENSKTRKDIYRLQK